mmetsp:Transcript_73510/g.163316  ORF Transcript_73510/g.163316 Transcript_73510/m.163316 type:complete len:221 (+) Transcript_73510:937-1599(+)
MRSALLAAAPSLGACARMLRASGLGSVELAAPPTLTEFATAGAGPDCAETAPWADMKSPAATFSTERSKVALSSITCTVPPLAAIRSLIPLYKEGSAKHRTDAAPPSPPSTVASLSVPTASTAAELSRASVCASASSSSSCSNPGTSVVSVASWRSACSTAVLLALGQHSRSSICARATGSTVDAFSWRNAVIACAFTGLFACGAKCSSSRSARSIVERG